MPPVQTLLEGWPVVDERSRSKQWQVPKAMLPLLSTWPNWWGLLNSRSGGAPARQGLAGGVPCDAAFGTSDSHALDAIFDLSRRAISHSFACSCHPLSTRGLHLQSINFGLLALIGNTSLA
jgi:hypothetical protein